MSYSTWVDQFLGLLSPPHCTFCADDAEDGKVCDACRAGLPWNPVQCPGCALPQAAAVRCRACLERPRAFDAAWAPLVLQPPVRQGVHRLKYGAHFEQARVLGSLMADALAARAEPLPDLIVPVPLHRWRLLRRGYNQSAELARLLHRRLGIEVDFTAARRTRATRDQIGQSGAERRRNVRGAFGFSRDLSGLHLTLLDDVMTTGATLDELARAARLAGATRVDAWALARAP